jgi:hypothetical protein
MDLYANFQGLKHNFKKKFGGVFIKLPALANFSELMNYFSIEKSVE